MIQERIGCLGASVPDKTSLTEKDIRSASVLLAYQPVYDVSTRAPIFFEALMRVVTNNGVHHVAGALSEHLGLGSSLGTELDRSVLRVAVADLLQFPCLKSSLNVSISTLVSRPWMDDLDHHLKTNPNLSGRLLIEIDEGSIHTLPGFVSDFIREYQPKGIRFALDNFGKGDVSLKHLPKFQFDVLKIDQYFVRGVETDIDKAFMVKVLCLIAEEFDFVCVAEKVESAAEARVLGECGIIVQQGNFYHSPYYPSTFNVNGNPYFQR